MKLYKIVREDYTDYYTGTIKYEVGTQVTAPDWNPDGKIVCGHGLHASPTMAETFGNISPSLVAEFGCRMLVLNVSKKDCAHITESMEFRKFRFSTCFVEREIINGRVRSGCPEAPSINAWNNSDSIIKMRVNNDLQDPKNRVAVVVATGKIHLELTSMRNRVYANAGPCTFVEAKTIGTLNLFGVRYADIHGGGAVRMNGKKSSTVNVIGSSDVLVNGSGCDQLHLWNCKARIQCSNGRVKWLHAQSSIVESVEQLPVDSLLSDDSYLVFRIEDFRTYKDEANVKLLSDSTVFNILSPHAPRHNVFTYADAHNAKKLVSRMDSVVVRVLNGHAFPTIHGRYGDQWDRVTVAI